MKALNPRVNDPECVYAERTSGLARAGAFIYFLYWWDYRPLDVMDPTSGKPGWRGQIFHSETRPLDAATALATKLGKRAGMLL